MVPSSSDTSKHESTKRTENEQVKSNQDVVLINETLRLDGSRTDYVVVCRVSTCPLRVPRFGVRSPRLVLRDVPLLSSPRGGLLVCEVGQQRPALVYRSQRFRVTTPFGVWTVDGCLTNFTTLLVCSVQNIRTDPVPDGQIGPVT